MAITVREAERSEKLIRSLLRLPENKRCVNCNSVGPQYVCSNFNTFVCTTCSGIHREFSHRIKSVSMSKFSREEAMALEAGGNEKCRATFLKSWNSSVLILPDNGDPVRLRDFIRAVYVEKRFSGSSPLQVDSPPAIKPAPEEAAITAKLPVQDRRPNQRPSEQKYGRQPPKVKSEFRKSAAYDEPPPVQQISDILGADVRITVIDPNQKPQQPEDASSRHSASSSSDMPTNNAHQKSPSAGDVPTTSALIDFFASSPLQPADPPAVAANTSAFSDPFASTGLGDLFAPQPLPQAPALPTVPAPGPAAPATPAPAPQIQADSPAMSTFGWASFGSPTPDAPLANHAFPTSRSVGGAQFAQSRTEWNQNTVTWSPNPALQSTPVYRTLESQPQNLWYQPPQPAYGYGYGQPGPLSGPTSNPLPAYSNPALHRHPQHHAPAPVAAGPASTGSYGQPPPRDSHPPKGPLAPVPPHSHPAAEGASLGSVSMADSSSTVVNGPASTGSSSTPTPQLPPVTTDSILRPQEPAAQNSVPAVLPDMFDSVFMVGAASAGPSSAAASVQGDSDSAAPPPAPAPALVPTPAPAISSVGGSNARMEIPQDLFSDPEPYGLPTSLPFVNQQSSRVAGVVASAPGYAAHSSLPAAPGYSSASEFAMPPHAVDPLPSWPAEPPKSLNPFDDDDDDDIGAPGGGHGYPQQQQQQAPFPNLGSLLSTLPPIPQSQYPVPTTPTPTPSNQYEYQFQYQGAGQQQQHFTNHSSQGYGYDNVGAYQPSAGGYSQPAPSAVPSNNPPAAVSAPAPDPFSQFGFMNVQFGTK